MQLNASRSRLHPRAALVRASLRRRLSAEYCGTTCERLIYGIPTSAESFEARPPLLARHRLSLNVARLLHLTCRGLHALAAAAGSTSEPSRSLISSASLA